MATTQVAICNVALLRVGVTRRIASITADIPEARACLSSYDPSLEEVLEAFDWPFARGVAVLALVETFTVGEWGFSYRLPSDCVKARYLESGVRRDRNTPPFTIAADAIGLLVLTDTPDARLVYTVRCIDPALYSGSFAMALSWRMAMDLAPALSKDLKWSERAEARYPLALSLAAANALNGTIDDELPDAESIQARV